MTALAPLALFIVLWSSGYVVGKLGVEAAPVFMLLTLRFTLAFAVATPLALRVDGWRRAPLRRIAIVGVLLQALQFCAVYGGLELGVPPALSALITLGLAPVVATGMAVASGMEHPGARTWLALGAGVAGVAVSVAPELGSARVGAGVALTVLGMLGLAGGTVLQKRWAGGVDIRISLAVQLGAALLVVAPLAAITGQFAVHPSAQLGLSLVWLAFPLSLGAVALMVVLLRRHQASTVSAQLLLVPAVTAVMSALALGDRLHPVSLAGMAIALGSVLTVTRAAAPAGETANPRQCARGQVQGGEGARPAVLRAAGRVHRHA